MRYFQKLIFILLLSITQLAHADDGYRLWLKFDLVANIQQRNSYAQKCQFIYSDNQEVIIKTAQKELQAGLSGLLGKKVSTLTNPAGKRGNNSSNYSK
jgi:alpha-glucuronidase